MSLLRTEIAPANGGVQRVAIGGRLDTHTYAELDQALAPLLGNPAVTSLVLDLEGLDYISSAGIRCILKARKALAPTGKVLAVNPQAQIRKVLDMVQALPLGDIFNSTAEADAYIDALQQEILQGNGGA